MLTSCKNHPLNKSKILQKIMRCSIPGRGPSTLIRGTLGNTTVPSGMAYIVKSFAVNFLR